MPSIKPMILSNIHYAQAIMLHHAVWNACDNWRQHSHNVTSLPHTNFCGLTLGYWSILETALETNLYKLKALLRDCILVTNGTYGKLYRFWCKNILCEWQISLHQELLVLFRQEILWVGNYIPEGQHIHLSYGKILVLNYYDFLGRKIS